MKFWVDGALVDASPDTIVEAYATAQLRCLCPTCLRLDKQFSSEGYQLALFPYRAHPSPRLAKRHGFG